MDAKAYPKLENTFKVLGRNLMDSVGIFILLVEMSCLWNETKIYEVNNRLQRLEFYKERFLEAR